MRRGRFVLRIEDIDQGRCRPDFEQAIFTDLAWLGLTWDGPVWRQSERMDVYGQAIDLLADRGLIYRCFKTRAELTEHLNAPHGPAADRTATARLPENEEEEMLRQGRAFAWRLDARAARAELATDSLPYTEQRATGTEERYADLRSVGDEVLARKDVRTSYHLASVVDDAAQGVSLVWRGEDLRDAIPIHCLIQELLGLPAPHYRHHRLILNAEGHRLAKRDRAETLRSRREAGETPEMIRQQLGLSARV